MITMRQRLLLTAGWIVAVVGSGLVASAAVSVAGGQVSDRPLRPLTAAEVAALPVERPVAVVEPIEPLASGGSGSTSDNLTGRSDRIETVPGNTDGPAGAGGAPAASSDARGVSAPPDPEPIERGVRSEAAVIQLGGGSASIGVAGDRIALLWATPRPGHVAELRFESEDQLTVTFTGPRIRYVLDAAAVDGRLLVETSEEQFR